MKARIRFAALVVLVRFSGAFAPPTARARPRAASYLFLSGTRSAYGSEFDPIGKNPDRFILSAKPRRLGDNAEGVVYVNDRCINCAACSGFAPATFARSPTTDYHIVTAQPTSRDEIERARAALAACPVAAIRVETLAERRHHALDTQAVEYSWTTQDEQLVRLMGLSEKSGMEKPFPRPFPEPHSATNVYWLGHHNDASFGAVPYLLRTSVNGTSVWIMVDTPRFSSSSVKAVTSLTGPSGPDYHFLTHVDDTADHGKWVGEFPNLKRIFHSGDLGRYNWLRDETLNDVEILLPVGSNSKPEPASGNKFLTAYTLDGELLDHDWMTSSSIESHPVVILHTPGHSPGSITLYKRPIQVGDKEPGILFTGDTYAFSTRDGGRMTGFPRYGNSLSEQKESLQQFLKLDWDVVAPGHGHFRDYRGIDNKKEVQLQELRVAQEELLQSSSPRW